MTDHLLWIVVGAACVILPLVIYTGWVITKQEKDK